MAFTGMDCGSRPIQTSPTAANLYVKRKTYALMMNPKQTIPLMLAALALAVQGCAIYKGGQEALAIYPGFGFTILPSMGPHSHHLVPVPVNGAAKLVP